MSFPRSPTATAFAKTANAFRMKMPAIPFQDTIKSDEKAVSPMEEELQRRVHSIQLPRELENAYHIRLVRIYAPPVVLLGVKAKPKESIIFSDPLNKFLAYWAQTEERTGDYVVRKNPNSQLESETCRLASFALSSGKTQHLCQVKIANGPGRKYCGTVMHFLNKSALKESWIFETIDGHRFKWVKRHYSLRSKTFFWELLDQQSDEVVATTKKLCPKDGSREDENNYPLYINASCSDIRDTIVATLILVEQLKKHS